jgi:uncharacterized phiE125 gp8 family phage protein
MKPILITAPTEEPVSLAELKGHLRITNTDDDADLSLKLFAATAWVRNELGRALITSTLDIHLKAWPRGFLYLPFNVQSITHVKYTDSAGVLRTVEPTTYKLVCAYDPLSDDTDMGAARLYLAYGQSWPSDTLDVGEPIVIRFVAGWANAASVPTPIRQAVLMLAAHWYRNRDAVVLGNTAAVVSAEVALGVQRLIAPYEDRRW